MERCSVCCCRESFDNYFGGSAVVQASTDRLSGLAVISSQTLCVRQRLTT